MKLNLDHVPRRLKPTSAEVQDIRGALHLRAQLPPDDPNRLVAADGAKHSWGGALMWSIGCQWQESPAFLAIGILCLAYVVVADPMIALFQ